jgi:glycosyltransferase involved in cell wall biosynthesis
MIEALACGTPIIAKPCGSVPEVLRDGVTGFLATDLDSFVSAVGKIPTLSRQKCREEFETRFTADVMTANYERIYYRLVDDRRVSVSQQEMRPTVAIEASNDIRKSVVVPPQV